MSDNHCVQLGVQSYWGPLGDSIEHASALPCLSSKEGVYPPILVCYCFTVPAGSVSKEPTCNAGDPDSMHGSWNGNPLEKEIATYSSVLAWRIPGTGEPGGLLSMGSHKVGHDWSDLAAAAAYYVSISFTNNCIVSTKWMYHHWSKQSLLGEHADCFQDELL